MKIAILVLLFLTAAAGQSPGTFTATGNLTVNRPFPRATLLPNGKVLITGYGFSGAAAELYDPFTGTFAPTGNTRAWAINSATLLADGRVLITGGYDSGGAISKRAELYDAATGTFTITGEMTTARVGHTATLLTNGKVLFLGGEVQATRPADITAELYDPATGAFTPTGTFIGAGLVGGATLLPDGRVLVVGPYSGPGLYDPGSGTFSPTGRGSYPHGLTSIVLTNGKVLFTGGIGDNGEDIHADLYDPVTGLFTPTGNMTTPRLDHSVTLLADGTVLLAGSQRTGSDGGRIFGSAELYDPVTGTFSATGDMITPRFGHAAPLLPDGTVLMVGTGSQYVDSVPVPPAELYHPLVLKPAPVLLSLAQGQGAILHANTAQLASSVTPAAAGEAVEIYVTGLMDGSVIPPQVAIGGRMAEVLWFGITPGYPGLNQINVRVPAGISPGPAVPVRINYIGRPSNEVTIAIQ